MHYRRMYEAMSGTRMVQSALPTLETLWRTNDNQVAPFLVGKTGGVANRVAESKEG
jgi:hypothetical protein